MPVNSAQEVDLVLREAIERLLERDRHLLLVDANERSITHRLAIYVEDLVGDEWAVDCEYNRVGGGEGSHNQVMPKKVKYLSEFVSEEGDEPLVRDTKGRTVFPDIIIHRRGVPENAVVIEVKKTSSNVNSEFDLAKLNAFFSEDTLRYQLGAFVKLGVGPQTGQYGVRSLAAGGDFVLWHSFERASDAEEFES